MPGYAETTPLAPSPEYGRSEGITVQDQTIFQPQHKDRGGEIIVYALAGLNTLLIIFIIVGHFFIAKPMKATLRSAKVSNLRYSSSLPSPYFNATIAIEISIENPNRGPFEFLPTRGDIRYDSDVVGEMTIDGQTVKAKGGMRMEVLTQVAYQGNEKSRRLMNDIETGIVTMKSRAEFRGKVRLRGLSDKTVNLKCVMYLNLVDQVVQRLWCK